MINIKNSAKVDEDLGFGNNPSTNNQRLLNKDGSSNIKRTGLPYFKPYEAYNSMIYMSWRNFWFIIFFSYVIINLSFAVLYYVLGMEYLNGSSGGNSYSKFYDAIFFSAQTFSTVGYGHISPIGFATNVVAAFESFIGLLTFAMAASLLYGRFSRPLARMIYSRQIILAPYKGFKAYMFRLANLRSNQLIEVEIEVLLSINVIENGTETRRFIPLTLERNKINLLTLSWTIVHPLDEESPLFGLNMDDLIRGEAEFEVFLKAFDDAFSQTVHSRTSYKPDEVVFDSEFEKIIQPDKDGVLSIDISKISNYHTLNFKN